MNTARIAAAIGLAAAGAGVNAQQLYGVATYAPFSTQSLYSIDATTGLATPIGSTGITNINGIAWNPMTSAMYAFTTDADVYTLNLFTGAASRLADRAATFPEGDLAIDSSGTAYVNNSVSLGTLDLVSGVFASIGAMGSAGDDVSGLTFDASGALWGYAKNGAAEDGILTIDLLTGSATAVGLTGITSASSVGGLAFEPVTSTLFLTDGDRLYTVDTASGAASLLGAHGVSGFSGLAIPAPGAGALVAGALLAASRRRR